MGGKKKKNPASAKKRRQQQRGQPRHHQQSTAATRPPSLDEVLAQADAALDASDVEAALRLFAYASDVLRKRIDGSSAAAALVGEGGGGGGGRNGGGEKAAASAGTTTTTDDDDAILLSRVLGRAGEARVSLGDPEGGREAFLEAIEVLGRGGDDEEDDERGGGGGGSSSLADAQLSEARAGLHLYLGQLSSGREALDSYRSGVRDLDRCVKILEGLVSVSSGGSDEMEEGGEGEKTSIATALTETRRQLCGAHCSIADLYMTDLCFEPDAEVRCESALDSALALEDGGAPDALQTRANLRLSQRRGDDAIRSILEAYGRIRVGCEAMADLVGLGREKGGEDGFGGEEKGQKKSSGRGREEEEKAKELVEVEAANSLPGFEFRCQTAKILLECAAYLSDDDGDDDDDDDEGGGGGGDNDGDKVNRRNMCVEASIQVLGSLLAENDEVVEVWYLLGCAFEASSPPDVDAARYYWETAMTMLTKVREGMEQQQQQQEDGGDMDGDGEGCLGEVIEQMNEIKERLAGLGDAKMSSDDVAMDES